MPFKNTGLTLPNLYNDELDALIVKNARRVFVPARTTFSAPGDDFNGVYYIKSGRVRYYMANDEGLEKVLYTLNDGWLFGEMSFYLGRKTGLYSQTELDTTLYKIPPEKCRDLLNDSPLFRDAFIRCLAHKILMARYEIENITFNPCKERILRLLCSAVDKATQPDPGWYDLKVKYTHYELGIIVGAARVTVSKILNELMNDGVIRSMNRRIQFSADKYEQHMKEFSEE